MKLLALVVFSFIFLAVKINSTPINSQQTSLVQCTQVICPKLNCSNYIKLPGECCSICINSKASLLLYGTFLFLFFLVTLSDDDHQCVVDNVTYEHRDTFHPVHRNDGSNPYCISCQCNVSYYAVF